MQWQQKKFDKHRAAIQTLWNEFFYNGMGEKLAKLVHENCNYPPQYQGTSLYLEFYLKGKYHRGMKCRNIATYTFIKSNHFKSLMDWSRSTLQKYDNTKEINSDKEKSPITTPSDKTPTPIDKDNKNKPSTPSTPSKVKD